MYFFQPTGSYSSSSLTSRCAFLQDPSRTGNTAAIWERRAPQLIAVLAASAPQLRRLDHKYQVAISVSAASALPAELGRLRQLTSLALDFGSAGVTTAQVNTTVQSLPSLQQLSLLGEEHSLLDGFPVSIATSCPQVRDLEIRGGRLDVPPELGRLTALTRLELVSSGALSLPASTSRLTALRSLGVTGDAALSLPFGLTKCRQLTSLTLRCDVRSPVLARLHTLRFLHAGSEREEHLHAREWSQLTALAELHIICSNYGMKGLVPSAVQVMTGLRVLHISSAELRDLPTGPYLSSVESLRMDGCTFHTGIPSSLAAAAQLRQLDLGDGNVGVHLSSADVSVVSAIPRLRTLRRRKPDGVDQSVWEGRLAGLRAACIAKGRVPPALTL